MPKRSLTAVDRRVAGLLIYEALLEIRLLARRPPKGRTPEETLERIAFLADLVHNLPGAGQPGRPEWETRRERAMRERPMSWTWNTTGDDGRAWILRHAPWWTPPPPLPTARRNARDWTWRRRLQVLAGWPVPTPPGKTPLAQVMKKVNTDEPVSLYADDSIRADLAPTAWHYVYPDPGPYNWPDAQNSRWLCSLLLTMKDGELIRGSVRLDPATFHALPSTVPRLTQRRLVLRARMLERDLGLWKRT